MAPGGSYAPALRGQAAPHEDRFVLPIAAAFLGTCLTLGSARATVNFFRPISGAEFDGGLRDGAVVNEGDRDSSPYTTRASLGHAAGGLNGFTVFGRNSGRKLTCEIHTQDGSHDGFGPVAVGSTTALGAFSFRVITSMPTIPDTFYTIVCTLPGASAIIGVTPDN